MQVAPHFASRARWPYISPVTLLARLRRTLFVRIGLTALLAAGSAASVRAEAHPHCSAPQHGAAAHGHAAHGAAGMGHDMAGMAHHGGAVSPDPDCPHCPPQECARSASCAGAGVSLAPVTHDTSAPACRAERERGAPPVEPGSAAAAPPTRPPRLPA